MTGIRQMMQQKLTAKNAKSAMIAEGVGEDSAADREAV
jgi:hypothetical protein